MPVIISYYITVPNLLLFAFRQLMLKHFEINFNIKKEILSTINFLENAKNINFRVIESILVTHGFNMNNFQQFENCISFFTKDKKGELSRNKVAHDIISTINNAKNINQKDCFVKFKEIINFLKILSKSIEEFRLD